MTKITKTPYAFIPKRLEIENRPDLLVFPKKVVYMSYKVGNDKNLLCGTSSYVPAMQTLEQAEDRWEMRYDNEYGGDSWLRIIYHPKDGCYTAEKYILGKLAALTHGGPDWKEFFIKLTMAGLQNDEDCMFLPQKVKEIGHEENQMSH